MLNRSPFSPGTWSRRLGAVTLMAVLSAGAWQAGLSTVLRAASTDAVQYLLTLGFRVPGVLPATFVAGTSPGTFTSPQGVVYDAAGRLYVTDTNCWVCEPVIESNRLQVFGPDRQHLYDVQTNDGTPLYVPVGMAIDATGKLLVADWYNDRIVLFSAATDTAPAQMGDAFGVSGNYDPLDPDRDVTQGWHAGTPPVSPLVFWGPAGIAIKTGTVLNPSAATADPSGRVAVVDNSNHRVVVLDSKLDPIYAFGGHLDDLDSLTGSMEYPWGVAIDPAGLYYVADQNNNRIQVFREIIDSQGKLGAQFVRMFGSAHPNGVFGSTPGDIAKPTGVNFDSNGRLWVADSLNHRLLRIDVTQSVAPGTSLPACADLDLQPTVGRRCLIATSDPAHTYEAVVLGANGSGTNGLFRYPSAVGVSASGEVAVADTQNHVVQIFAAPRLALSILAPDTNPGPCPGTQARTCIDSPPHAVQIPFNFSVALKNDGDLPLNVTVSPTAISGAQPFAGTFGGLTTRNIPAGATVPFPMTFTPSQPTPSQPGTFSIKVTASGIAAALAGGYVDGGSLTLAGGPVAPAIGLVTTAVGSPHVTVNDIFTLTVQLRNTGATDLTIDPLVIQVDGAGTVQPYPPGSTPVPLTVPGLTLLEPTYQFTLATAGQVTFRVSATAKYVDPADNVQKSLSSVATPLTFTISNDGIAPTTTATLPPLPPTNPLPAEGWYNSDVSVRLEAFDNPGGTGVDFLTYMIVQDNTWQFPGRNPADVLIEYEGTTSLRFHAQDRVPVKPNIEAVKTVVVKIDRIAPVMGVTTISHLVDNVLSTLPPASGWYRTNPTITFSAAEDGSGLFFITPPVTITDEGANQTVTGYAVDKAGNRSGNTSVVVNVDKTPPTLLCSAGSPIVWPPNHKMVEWRPVVTVNDPIPTSGGVTFWLEQAFSSDPDKGKGDGNFGEDMQEWTLGRGTAGQPDMIGKVRAERSGTGVGRTYTLVYKAADLAGNTASCTINLTVPHDQSKKK
jgi:hypothetical protein